MVTRTQPTRRHPGHRYAGARRRSVALAGLGLGLSADLAGAADLATTFRAGLLWILLVALLAALVAVSVVMLALLRRSRRAEQALRASEERFAAAIAGSQEGIWDWNIVTGETYYSPRWKEILGYGGAPGEIEPHIDVWRNRIHPEDRAEVLELLKAHLQGASEFLAVDHRLQSRSGEYLWVQLRGKAQFLQAPGGAPVPVRMAGSLIDITERKLQEAALARLSLHDPLTGLPNRMLLYERLNQALAQARRQRHPLAVVVLDIKNFNDINEAFGHPSGDALLEDVAMRLLRGRPDEQTVARFAGDAFALLIPSAPLARADTLAQDLLRLFEAPYELGGKPVPLGARLGMSFSPEHGEDTVTLLQRAEIALYRARQQKSDFAVYDLGRDQAGHRYFAFDTELRQAVARNELRLYYQPVMSLHTGYITSVEALVRWQHPTHGLIGPDAFIPRAEHLGLVNIPTYWILEQTLAHCAAWARAGHPISVAVNLSVASLQEPRLPDQVALLLKKTGVPAQQLQFEITESTLMTDPARAREILERLRAMKVGLIIDDFGTGYASLSYLKELPVDKIKLDKSFVTNMLHDEGDREIVQATIMLARRFGLQVVAEGVESEDVLKTLAVLGCDHAQGHYISPPLPEAELIPWLEKSGWEDAPRRRSAVAAK